MDRLRAFQCNKLSTNNGLCNVAFIDVRCFGAHHDLTISQDGNAISQCNNLIQKMGYEKNGLVLYT